MRKVTAMAYGAFMADENLLISNTKVTSDENQTRMYLFDNLIAIKNKKTGEIEISFAGWFFKHNKRTIKSFCQYYN